MFDFSKRLLKLRKSRGLSQIELAQKVQISSSTLGNYGQYILGKPANGLGNRAIYQPAAS